MEQISNKHLQNRLHQLLTSLGLKDETITMTVVSPTTKKPRSELRNQYKKIMKVFKTLDYDQKLRELLALEIRVQAEEDLKKQREEQANSTTIDATAEVVNDISKE